MPLGMELGLGPGDILLDGDPVHLMQRGIAAPTFAPCLLWPNGCPSQQLLSSCCSFNNLKSEILHPVATISSERIGDAVLPNLITKYEYIICCIFAACQCVV